MNPTTIRYTSLCGALMLAQPLVASTPPTPDLTNLDCVIEPYMQVELGSRVDGILDNVLVDRGDTVTVNSVVAQLESSVEEAAVNAARARAELEAEIRSQEVNLAFGRRNQERINELHTKKVVAFHEIDRVETETKVALYDLQQAKENKKLAQLDLDKASAVLNRHTIRSPINGVVVDRYLNPGESVEEKAIVKLAQIDPLRVEVIAPVTLFGQINKGRFANVYPESPIGGEHLSTVEVVDPVLDAASGTFRIRLILPNPEQKLTSGLRCKVSFLDDAQARTTEAATVERKEAKPVLAHEVPSQSSVDFPDQSASATEDEPLDAVGSHDEATSRGNEGADESADQTARTDKPAVEEIQLMVVTSERKTMGEARILARQMREKGIKDLWIIPKGRLAGRISVGLYSNMAFATARQQEIADLGFVTEILPQKTDNRGITDLRQGPDISMATTKR